MSYYDYDEYYAEPSEFEEKCSELVQMLKDSATEELKSELGRLRKENAEMKDIVNNYNQKVKELEQAKRSYEWNEQSFREKITKEVRKLRLSKLLEDFQTTLYIVRNNGKDKPKCDKCDEEGYIHYLSPRGDEKKEKCECRDKIPFYEVEQADCCEFKIRDEWGNEKIVGWYRRHISDRSGHDDYYDSATYASDKIYNGTGFDKIVNYYYVYFRDKETAQEYADWLNKESRDTK